MSSGKEKNPVCTVVGGHGAHIKATRESLNILSHGKTSEVPLADLDHLLIIGGHSIQTAAITTLLKQDVFISFFESDGEPSGYLVPYRYSRAEEVAELQKNTPPFQYARTFAKGAVAERILALGEWGEQKTGDLFFSGERDILDQASREIDNLIRIEEIHRVDQLVGDMYYEIMSRLIDPGMAFRRRSTRPYTDPVNTILSFGYAMLMARCTRALISLHLNPDGGMLHRGKRSLAWDFCNCWKTRMIDIPALGLIQSGGVPGESYETGEKRCVLSDALIHTLIRVFQQSITPEVIDLQTGLFLKALRGDASFEIVRH